MSEKLNKDLSEEPNDEVSEQWTDLGKHVLYVANICTKSFKVLGDLK